jgi:hypothetical protein
MVARGNINGVHPEMVGCGSDQGRSVLATTGVLALRRGLPKLENAGLGRKMLFVDGHEIAFETTTTDL